MNTPYTINLIQMQKMLERSAHFQNFCGQENPADCEAHIVRYAKPFSAVTFPMAYLGNTEFTERSIGNGSTRYTWRFSGEFEIAYEKQYTIDSDDFIHTHIEDFLDEIWGIHQDLQKMDQVEGGTVDIHEFGLKEVIVNSPEDESTRPTFLRICFRVVHGLGV